MLQAQTYKDRQAAVAASVLPPGLRNVGLDQKLNAQVPLGLVFRDEAGRELPLASYFGSRPVILALAYYQCPMLCTQVLNGLVISLRGMSLESGRDFEVVVVSIDATETPDLAARKKAAYLRHYTSSSSGCAVLRTSVCDGRWAKRSCSSSGMIDGSIRGCETFLRRCTSRSCRTCFSTTHKITFRRAFA